MKHFGLIGRPLGHSLSRQLFLERFPLGDYRLFELPSAAQAPALGLDGFNVTSPFKVEILPLLDALDPEAQAIGAVNCVSLDQGRLVGHNTDWRAFADTLRPLLHPWHTSALILGRGGAARAVRFALQSLGIDCRLVSRDQYTQAFRDARHTFLLVNCTPLGMTGQEALTPWRDTSMLSPRHLCYDLVYSPSETRFLLEAQLAGAQTQNGLPMLRRQAELSWQWWGLL